MTSLFSTVYASVSYHRINLEISSREWLPPQHHQKLPMNGGFISGILCLSVYDFPFQTPVWSHLLLLFLWLLVEVLFTRETVCLRGFYCEGWCFIVFILLFWDKILCGPDWHPVHDVAKDVLERLLIYWDHRPRPRLLFWFSKRVCFLTWTCISKLPFFWLVSCFKHVTINLCWRSRRKIHCLSWFSYSICKEFAFLQLAGHNRETCRSRREWGTRPLTSCSMQKNCPDNSQFLAVLVPLSPAAVGSLPKRKRKCGYWLLPAKPTGVPKHSLEHTKKREERKFRKAKAGGFYTNV